MYNNTTEAPPMEVYASVPEPERSCRVCGCHNSDACYHPMEGNCWWVAPDLCSHCHQWPGEATRHSIIAAEEATDGAFCD